ncbi:hypothetical protein [Paenibacillus agricola]|uniref:Uncharacterized protein n=1 Tax=Paenibacillus agricola TaxID=2716264 RepID=A0ABX0JIR7_9BACL|nr:hypothetical protein [Paenibacillus agricola]NHN35221.1 hypothetical protein [Paenibacillus agricola]
MSENSRFYVVYDEYLITICSRLDDVFDELAEGGTIYGYTDNEEVAQSMLRECFQELATRNN